MSSYEVFRETNLYRDDPAVRHMDYQQEAFPPKNI